MDQKTKVNLIACLVDNIDQLLTELQPEYRQGMKQMCNEALKHTRRFIRECDRIFPPSQQENFGIASDEIREILDFYIKENDRKDKENS